MTLFCFKIEKNVYEIMLLNWDNRRFCIRLTTSAQILTLYVPKAKLEDMRKAEHNVEE